MSAKALSPIPFFLLFLSLPPFNVKIPVFILLGAGGIAIMIFFVNLPEGHAYVVNKTKFYDKK